MDLKQAKLTKSEWEGVERSVSPQELEILKLITGGFHQVHLRINKADSLFSHLKVEYSVPIEDFLYAKFFADRVRELVEAHALPFVRFDGNAKKRGWVVEEKVCYISAGSLVKLRSGDQIRMSRITLSSSANSDLFDFTLCDLLERLVRNKCFSVTAEATPAKGKKAGVVVKKREDWMYEYYTLSQLTHNKVERVNGLLLGVVQACLHHFQPEVSLLHIVQQSPKFIEKNHLLLKYEDLTLYQHQKDIFTAIKRPGSKLVLYIAPTGTGKTLSPLGISEQFKVIFVCAARHVGIALARAAISIHKRIAFAFGCSAAEDVRLHYFAAKECIRDKRSGDIRKVDNTVGDKVEIIICDIRSYLPAMYYMAAFNDPKDIVTYWDEPTISMDYESHDLHKVIRKNWKHNLIPNMVLSSATLPKEHELAHVVSDFKSKFEDAVTINLVSHDCRKSIPLIDNNGFVVMPHFMHSEQARLLEVVQHCEDNPTLLRYFDLEEAARLIGWVETDPVAFLRPFARFSRNFASIQDISMSSVKMHYLKVLKGIVPDRWSEVYAHFQALRAPRLRFNHTEVAVNNGSNKKGGGALQRVASVATVEPNHQEEHPMNGTCGICITTKDAYTLTDGPTIFVAGDLEKIAKFCIQKANIPNQVMENIMRTIESNNTLNQQMDQWLQELVFEETKMATKLSGSVADSSREASKLMGSKSKKSKDKIANKLVDKTENWRIAELRGQIAAARSAAKVASLDDLFVPNKLRHLQKWAAGVPTDNAFTSNLNEQDVVRIMLLKDVADSWKVLLMLGIGVFTEHKSIEYTEIMKSMADQQKLYLIIADSDYIYGTNYQFCHGYLGKDLALTQEKIIQALGRIGRNNVQQEYSARFRDNAQIDLLFSTIPSEQKREVINMNQLLSSVYLRWNGEEFVEEEDPDAAAAEEEEEEEEEKDKEEEEEDEDEEEEDEEEEDDEDEDDNEWN